MKKVIVLDSETTNSLEEPICYDIGWAVIDLDTNEVLKTRSFAVAEVFLDKELMSYAFFVDKVPEYWDEIKRGERRLARLSTIRWKLVEDCRDFEIKDVFAHNARFDYLSCSLTQRYLTGSKYRYFFPYGTTVHDTLKMSRKAFGNDKEYSKFCHENEYLTTRGQNKFTAEVLYRYLTNDTEFEEQHKGIDDVLIEKEILLECIKRGIIDGKLFE